MKVNISGIWKDTKESRKLDIVKKNIAMKILLNQTWRLEVPSLFDFEYFIRQGFYSNFMSQSLF